MPLEVVVLGEGLVAEVALIGPGTCVQVHVVLQVVAVQEAGAAVLAGVGPLACVLPHVDLQFVIPGVRTHGEMLALSSWHAMQAQWGGQWC